MMIVHYILLFVFKIKTVLKYDGMKFGIIKLKSFTRKYGVHNSVVS
jgi:hypothetical protein